MGEAHTKGGERHYPVASAATDSRSPPFRPYAYGGETEEPPAVTAARERHRALNAAPAARLRELEARQSGGVP